MRNRHKNCIKQLQRSQVYNYYYIIKMDSAEFGQFSETTFEEFLSKSNQVQCKVIGTVTSISKHKKYIVEVMLNRKAVIRCYKRFSQFEALYELIKKKFPVYEIEEFPSKFQIFDKEETRKSYFQNLLNQIVKDYAKENLQVNKDLMLIVYNFLTFHIEQSKLRKEMINQKKLQKMKDQQNVEQSMETDAVSESGKKVIKKKIEQSFQQKEETERKHKGSIDLGSSGVMIMRTRSNSTFQQPVIVDQAPEIQQNVYDNEFEIKFANEETWKTGYIEIKDSNMYVFKSKNDNHFKTCIELYRIHVEYLKRDMNLFDHLCDRTELNLTRTFNENQDVLSLYHEYDHNKILIRKPCPENYSVELNRFNTMNLKDQIVQASRKEPKSSNFDGVFHPIGKIFIFIHKLKCNWRKHSEKEKIWLRIKTGALVHHIMPVSYSNEIEINQGFLLPVSNTFERVRIECYSAKEMKENGNVIGVFKFSMVEFFAKPERSLVEKLEVNLETEEDKEKDYETRLELSLENLSDFSSIYSNSYSNQYDGMTMQPISGLDDVQDFSISINRILAMLGKVSLLIRAFQRNVIKFKYPILGYGFFLALLINVAFIPITYIIRQLMAFILLCIVYQQEHAHIIMKHLMDTYIFSYIHPSFKSPEVLSTGEITHLKWAHQLKYIAEDFHFKDGRLEKKSDKKRDVYEFKVHERVFIVTQNEQSFFEKLQEVRNILDMVYKIVNTLAFTLEKIANLFSWVDFRKTIFLALLVLICTGIASGTTFQLAICLVCTLKLIKGTSYYSSKLYEKNRRFAVYAMRYILEKSFPEIIGGKNIHEHMDYIELNQYISDLSFPIHDESAQKKLRNEMDRVMGVYLEPEALYPKATKENNLKLVYLLDMIETCEEKLKLKFIAGEEGISNNYQQLKQETKDIEDLDDWFKEAAYNFVMNIPSKLFMIFHKTQLHRIERAEIIQSNGNETELSTEMETDSKEAPKAKAEPLEFQKTKVMVDPQVIEAEIIKEKIVVNKQVSMV